MKTRLLSPLLASLSLACGTNSDAPADTDAASTDTPTSVDSGGGPDSGPDPDSGANTSNDPNSGGNTSGDETGLETSDTTAPGEPTICDASEGFSNPGPGVVGHSEVAHWKYDRRFVLSINFDDSTPGQAQIGVPAMIERGLVGTWFVNPGQAHYEANVDTWETLAPHNGQELANHSMNHAGAMDFEDADYQIGEAAAIIRAAYPPERSPLMAFNRGGGTNWNITEDEMAQLLDEHDQVERVHSSGIAPATSGDTMYSNLTMYMQAETPADNWTRIHFHGICDPADTVNCVCNNPGSPDNCREFGGGVNNGGVSATDFLFLLDQLVTDSFFTEQVWIAGFASAHKYQTAREVTEAVVAADDGSALQLCVRSDLDPALYDEPLTFVTQVPADWTDCQALQSGTDGDCRLAGGTAQFEARINGGPVVLSHE